MKCYFFFLYAILLNSIAYKKHKALKYALSGKYIKRQNKKRQILDALSYGSLKTKTRTLHRQKEGKYTPCL